MSGNVVPFRRTAVRCAQTALACPSCRREAPVLNVGRVHWACCGSCGIRWELGENLFSTWTQERPADWNRNAVVLSRYRKVQS